MDPIWGYVLLLSAFLIVWGGTMYLWYSREADFRVERSTWRDREKHLLEREDQILNRVMSRDVADYSMAEAYRRNYADLKDKPEQELERDMLGAFGAEQAVANAE